MYIANIAMLTKRLSHNPFAILAIVLASSGAITIRSAQRRSYWKSIHQGFMATTRVLILRDPFWWTSYYFILWGSFDKKILFPKSLHQTYQKLNIHDFILAFTVVRGLKVKVWWKTKLSFFLSHTSIITLLVFWARFDNHVTLKKPNIKLLSLLNWGKILYKISISSKWWEANNSIMWNYSKVIISSCQLFPYVGIKGFSKFSLPQYVKQDLVLFSMPINKKKTRKKDPTLLKVTMMYISHQPSRI